MRTVGLARARAAAGVILGFVMVQGLALASDLSRFENSNAALPASADEGVLVSTDKLRYPSGETIVVQVSNTLDTPVTTRDQRFQCTIIALERRSESGREWTEIRSCFSGAPVSELTLEPGASVTIRLESGGGMSGPLEPGVYRAALDYSLGDRLSLAPGHLLVARSEQFQIE
jgi:hypothetical protein